MVVHNESFIKKHAELLKRREEAKEKKRLEKEKKRLISHLNELERRRKRYNEIKNNSKEDYESYLQNQAEYRNKYKKKKEEEIEERFSSCVKVVFNGYKKHHYVSKTGDIYTSTGRLLKKCKDKNGYVIVAHTRLVHRIVWETFNGEIPEGMEIDHINTIRDDNRLENLRLVTHKENCNNPISIENYKKRNKSADLR